MTHLPDVHWTLDGFPIAMRDWSANCNAGGHDQFRGQCPQTDFEALPWHDQGSVVRGVCDDGLVVWEGRLSTYPMMDRGVAHLAAQGHKYDAAKKSARLLIQTCDRSQWTTVDTDPFSAGERARKIDVQDGSRLKARMEQDILINLNLRGGWGFFAEECVIKQVSFKMSYDSGDASSNMDIEVRRSTGPNLSTTTLEDTYACTSGNAETTKTSTWTTGAPVAVLYVHCNTGWTPTAPIVYHIKEMKVWGDITTSGSFSAYEVLETLANKLGHDPGGIQSAFYNVLPFDWREGNWLEAALYAANLEDKAVRVLESRRNNKPIWEYGAWGETLWTVHRSEGAEPDLTPLEKFDKITVHYLTEHGVHRQAKEELSDLPWNNEIYFKLKDRQDSNAVPNNVADKLLNRYSEPRYSGSIGLVAATSNYGYRNPYAIRYGDRIRIGDFAPAQGLGLRVHDASYSPQGVTVGCEMPAIRNRKLRRRVKRVEHGFTYH